MRMKFYQKNPPIRKSKLFACPKTTKSFKEFLAQYSSLLKQVFPKLTPGQVNNNLKRITGVSPLSLMNYAHGNRTLSTFFARKICIFVNGLNDGAMQKSANPDMYAMWLVVPRGRGHLTPHYSRREATRLYKLGYDMGRKTPPNWKKIRIADRKRASKPYRRPWIGATNLGAALDRIHVKYGITVASLSRALNTPVKQILKWRTGYRVVPGTKSWDFENRLKNYIAGFQAALNGVSIDDLNLKYSIFDPIEYEKYLFKGYADGQKHNLAVT